MPQSPQPSSAARNFCMFALMFVTCLLGSVAIFVFAVGMETGNKVSNAMMSYLVANATLVLAAFVFFNVFVFFVYTCNKNKRSRS